MAEYGIQADMNQMVGFGVQQKIVLKKLKNFFE
jgi:hypothetical protein